MDAGRTEKGRTTTQRTSDREIVTTRIFDAPARIVYEAWSKPELFGRWWLPKSIGLTLVSCEMDVRVGGGYRLMIRQGASEPMAFHGKYLEVVPGSRMVWTNDESANENVTTVTFEEHAGQTRVAVSERFHSKEALDAAIASGELERDEAFGQLDALLAG